MNERKITNILLLIIAIPILFYVLKLLSFIFIPLFFSLFMAVLLWPLIRWLKKKKVPKIFNLFIVISIMILFITSVIILIKLSSAEILASNNNLLEKAEYKINNLIIPLEAFFEIKRNESVSAYYLDKINLNRLFSSTLITIKSVIITTLMTFFFAILLLSESLNLHDVLHKILVKQRFSSIKVFFRIEKDIITFVKVKFILSFFTGLGFSLACYYFDVSFPIFWGLLVFSLNFVQMIGSVVSVILLSIFALIEINTTGTLLFFILVISLIQIILGGILEPIFMGKSFSINVITVLVALMFWGFIWGVPGLILSIPITVLLKIIFDQFPTTKIISSLMSGTAISLKRKKAVTELVD